MEERETVKEFADRLVEIANKIRVLGTDIKDDRLVQKILVSVPERFEATIASLENSKELSDIKLTEQSFGGKGKKLKEYGRVFEIVAVGRSNNNKGGNHPRCQHCGKRNHPHYKCWRKPDMRCRKCQKLGHAEIICKEEETWQQGEAQTAVEEVVEQFFVASCFSSRVLDDCWLVDSDCINHMKSDEKLFRELDRSVTARVRIGNREYLAVKEKGYKVMFEEKKCLISDSKGQKLLEIPMKNKFFSLDPLKMKSKEKKVYGLKETPRACNVIHIVEEESIDVFVNNQAKWRNEAGALQNRRPVCRYLHQVLSDWNV
ncbi:uncharacterized protein LOC116193832 [Punica granatum]|uniref:Uncharacterized protein LOC116193832 n=1 Tax=Punica granatum TaxID=22663 RepID=A0A6P8C7I2_PUNGR|nr:uncharacterized protein LOC116193832 [Punica granatum]